MATCLPRAWLFGYYSKKLPLVDSLPALWRDVIYPEFIKGEPVLSICRHSLANQSPQ